MDPEQEGQQAQSQPAQLPQPSAPPPESAEPAKPLDSKEFLEWKRQWNQVKSELPFFPQNETAHNVDRLFATVEAVCAQGTDQRHLFDIHMRRISKLFSCAVAAYGTKGHCLLRRQMLEAWPAGATVEIKELPDGDVALTSVVPRAAGKARNNGKQCDMPPPPPILGPDGMPFPK